MAKIQVKFDKTKNLTQAQTASLSNQGTIYFVDSNNEAELKIILNNKDYTGYHKPSGGIPITDLDSTTQGKIGNGNTIYGELHNKKVTSWNNTPGDEYFPSEKLVYDSLTAKANLVDPQFTGTPTAPTADGNNTSQIANVAYVNNAFANASGAMRFKGIVNLSSNPTLPTTDYKAGDTYIVGENGTYASKVCEVGDMIVAVEDWRSGQASNNDWAVIQTNINGAVTGPASSTNGNIALFDGGTGKIIKDSSTQIADLLGTNEQYHYQNGSADSGKDIDLKPLGVQKIITKIERDSRNHLVGVTTENLPTYELADQNTSGLISAADKSKLDSITVANLQLTTNLVTSMSSSSTNTQYPSAKAVYDAIAAAVPDTGIYWEGEN